MDAMDEMDDESAAALTEALNSWRHQPHTHQPHADMASMVVHSPAPDASLPQHLLVQLVVDTNFILSHQRWLSALLGALSEDAAVLVPWIVVVELDGLKKADGALGYFAREAVRWLHGLFAQRHPRLHGQPASRASIDGSNDDAILAFAIDRAPMARLTVLLSSDKNLAVKALIHRIDVHAPKTPPAEFLTLLKQRLMASDEMDVEMADVDTGAHQSILNRSRAILEQLFALILDRFPPAMHRQFSATLGHDIYRDIALPEPWTAIDIFSMLQKHWMSVFSECFPRHSDRMDAQKATQTLLTLAKDFQRRGTEAVWSANDVQRAIEAARLMFQLCLATESLQQRLARDQQFQSWLNALN